MKMEIYIYSINRQAIALTQSFLPSQLTDVPFPFLSFSVRFLSLIPYPHVSIYSLYTLIIFIHKTEDPSVKNLTNINKKY